MRRADLTYRGFRGVHNASPPEELPAGYVADALDGCFTQAGVFEALPAMVAWGGAATRASFCRGRVQLVLAENGELHRLDDGQVLATELTGDWLAGDVLADATYLTDGQRMLRIDADGARPWTVDAPLPQAECVTGSIPPGQYELGATWVLADGRESHAEPFRVLFDVPGGLALRHTVPPPLTAVAARVYLTTQDGTELFLRGTWPIDLPEFRLIALGDAGPVLETAGLRPLPAGRAVAVWGARLAVAVDDTVVVSAPYLPHLWSTLGYRLEHPVTALAGLRAGLLVATSSGLWLLTGDDAAQATLVRLAWVSVHHQNPTPLGPQQLRHGDGWLPEGVLLVAESGVLHVSEDGTVTNLTADVYTFPAGRRAAGAMVTLSRGWQFIFSIEE
ncbi:hypothetical protein [Chitiniphilus eburneus]|uniref:Uncharacterized protein n=1 Tax=Chitiniphilus eburneus TaxID=2571148 RepID=A0A4U0PPB3_9NEIS|nr:hypothetical protein [Chitiniphilus eburneus]TJZ69740.1 hypothetical protein FAZ21_14575 [Chitiniphilus eburneus]